MILTKEPPPARPDFKASFPTEVEGENWFLSRAFAGRNTLLTGMAGTGKSYLLKQFIEGATRPITWGNAWPDGSWRPQAVERRIDITAPTGVAALNIGGMTIHRFSGMLLGPTAGQSDEEYFGQLEQSPYPSVRAGFRRVRECETLVIDEVSMLPGRQFTFLEWLFRRLRDSEKPWGGCHVIVTGDFLQLPPVRKSDAEPYDWCFQTEAWERSEFAGVLLKKVRRQDEPVFVDALAAVRRGAVTGEAAEVLHSRVVNFPSADLPRLFTHNAQVDKWNNFMLAELPGSLTRCEAEQSGNENAIKLLAQNLLCPMVLELKVGARVMFTVNDKLGRWVNGTIGRVVGFDHGELCVNIDDRMEVVDRCEWAVGEGSSRGCVTQYPLRLAYAMTIHKAQGITLDGAYVDVRAAREPGQAYVALSRVRTLAGLHLKEWFKGLYVSNDALNFYRRLEG
jgi:ATP-dependent DNA helicase PIF1